MGVGPGPRPPPLSSPQGLSRHLKYNIPSHLPPKPRSSWCVQLGFSLPPQLQATYPPCSCYHLPDCTVSEQMLEQNHVCCLSHLDGSAAPWCPGHRRVWPSRPPLFLKSPPQSCLWAFALAVPLPGRFPPVIMVSAPAIVSQITSSFNGLPSSLWIKPYYSSPITQ